MLDLKPDGLENSDFITPHVGTIEVRILRKKSEIKSDEVSLADAARFPSCELQEDWWSNGQRAASCQDDGVEIPALSEIG